MASETTTTSQLTAVNGKAEMPLPSTQEVLADFLWLYGEISASRMEKYRGQHVAAANRTLLGSGRDPEALRNKVAAEQQLDPARIAVTFVDNGEILF